MKSIKKYITYKNLTNSSHKPDSVLSPLEDEDADQRKHEGNEGETEDKDDTAGFQRQFLFHL